MTGQGHKNILIFGLISKHPGRNRGGTALSIRRLANFFAGQGLEVRIVMRDQGNNHFMLDALREGVMVSRIRSNSKVSLFMALCHTAMKQRPEVVLALDTRACLIASWLTLLPWLRVNVWASFRNELNDSHAHVLRRITRRCTGIICNSYGLARDLARLTGSPTHRIHVIHNLAVSPDIAVLASQPNDHPWLQGMDSPVICSAARLVPEKGFAYLIEAFQIVKKAYPSARLIILGEGPLLESLRHQAICSGVHDSVDFAGFQKNPWSFMARAQLFVLPSLIEAFGNVLAEALSLGIPVVATECPPYGPQEILEHGRYGRLVPPADSQALAEAVMATLDAPLPTDTLIAGARRFTQEAAGLEYCHTLGLDRSCKTGPS